MSDIRISDLQQISVLDSSNDVIPIVDVSENITKKITTNQINSSLSQSLSVVSASVPIVSGSTGFIPMFTGSNKLVNSKMFYDKFGDNTIIDSYLTVNKNSIFQNGVFLSSPTNLYDCYLVLGNDKVLFPSDSGEGLVMSSVHNDDTMLTLKGWNNTTTLTLDEDEIRTNKKLNVNGDSIVNGRLTVTGELVAETFHTEYVTSSVIYSSGSTKFGDTPDDTHQLTGSLNMSTGSINITKGNINLSEGTVNVSGDINGFSKLRIDDETNLYGQFTAYSFSIFDNQVQCNSDVTVQGISTLNGNTSLNGESTFNNNIYVNADILSEVNIQGGLNVTNQSTFNDDVTINGSTIIGIDNKDTHVFYGDVNIEQGGLTVSELTTFNGGLVTNNTSVFNDDVTVNAFLESNDIVSTNITVNGSLVSHGMLTNDNVVTGSGFNRFATTSSLNTLSSSLDTKITSVSSSLVNHTHTNFNNDLRISGSVAITGSLDVVTGTNKIQFTSQGASGDIPVGAAFWNYGGNFTLMGNPQGTSGHKIVVTSFNGSTWRSMMETANTGSSEPNLLLVKNGGRVGIGTSTPTQKLEVSGSIIGGQSFSLGKGGNYTLGYAFNRDFMTGTIYDNTRYAFQFTRPNNADRLDTEVYNGSGTLITSKAFTIDSLGNIGIGTNSPVKTLDVSGSLRVSQRTITNSTDTGTIGEICWDTNYIYVCTATNTWKRTALTTW